MSHYISSSIHLLALILRCRQKFYHIHFLSHHKKPLIQFSKARWSAKRVSGVRWGEDWGKLNKETPVPFKTANNTCLKQSSIKRNLHSTKRVLCITVPDLSFALTKAYTTLNESYFLLILNHLVYQRRTTQFLDFSSKQRPPDNTGIAYGDQRRNTRASHSRRTNPGRLHFERRRPMIITSLAPRTLRLLLDFWRMCALLQQTF
jgi:hypothetical protein